MVDSRCVRVLVARGTIEYSDVIQPLPCPLRNCGTASSTDAVQITRDATRISPADHERLRGVGFDDKGILQITLIASWFNYINRVADALGVGRE